MSDLLTEDLILALSPYSDGVRVGTLRKQYARQSERNIVHAKCADLRGETAGDDLCRIAVRDMEAGNAS